MGSVSGMLDDLKSRLGFAKDDGNYDADGYDDYDYDEYADFDDDRNDTGYRSSRTNSFGRPDSSPNLVSFDDVKAKTTVPERLQRDPLAPTSNLEPARVGGHYVIDNTAPAPSSPAYKAAQRDAQMRSLGIGSSATATQSSVPGAASTSSTYDPYEAYSLANPTAHTPSRQLTIVKPVEYSDVERVARAVKSGDVVVLAMRNTPDDLSKRLLDFSFGVASALDANVECPGQKVFAIAKGNALTEDEKRRLRAQGVL